MLFKDFRERGSGLHCSVKARKHMFHYDRLKAQGAGNYFKFYTLWPLWRTLSSRLAGVCLGASFSSHCTIHLLYVTVAASLRS